MKNIHVIPTDKPSRLCLSNNSILTIVEEANYTFSHIQSVNIYITNDEEIKEGDWLLIVDDFETYIHEHKGDNLPTTYYKKIILTTDQDLINDGVQAIPDEFLEWFVKNPSCEEVDFNWTMSAYNVKKEYRVVIPKVEPKQETLEEAAEKYVEDFDLSFYDTVEEIPVKELGKKDFIEGAKWQQEKNYSEEEVLKSADYLGFKQITSEKLNSLPFEPFITDEDGNIWIIDKEKWFNKLKKK